MGYQLLTTSGGHGFLAGGSTFPTVEDGLEAIAEQNDQAMWAYARPLTRGQVASGVDLNALYGAEHAGAWGLSSEARPNQPTLTTAGVLEIERTTGNTLGVLQRITAGDRVLYREAVDAAAGSWTPWTEVETKTSAAATFLTKSSASATYETKAGAQSKADAAEQSAKEYAGTLAYGTDLQASDAVFGGLVDDPNSVTGGKLRGWFARKGYLPRNVRDYGAVGDGTTNDLPAFQAAYNAAVAAGGGMIYVPAGRYRLNDEWDIYRANSPRRDIMIVGEDPQTTFILAGFYGTAKALIKAVDPAGTTRCSPTSLHSIQLGTVDRNGPNPVLFDILGWGESRMERVRFDTTNNTVARWAAIQNVRVRDVVSFNGGKHYNYKPTNGITFTSTAGSNTLTASADIFTGADPGRIISVYGTNGTRAKYVISTVTDARNVVVAGTTPAMTISGTGHFEPARITTTAGSAQVSANAEVFTDDDIGRVILIQNARAGSYGNALLRAKIVSRVSALTVVLDTAAGVSQTRTEFAVPVIDIWRPSSIAQTLRDNNDFKIHDLHLENYAGVGLAAHDTVFAHITNMKIHGLHTPSDSGATHGHMWLDDFAGVISGELDGMAMGQARIHLANMNDLLTFDWLGTRRVNYERIFEVEALTDPGGVTEVRSFDAYGATTSGDPYDLITDANTPARLVFTGMVNMLGDTLEPRIYHGRGAYFTLAGDLVLRSPDGTRYRLVVANGGALSTTPA